MAFLKKVLNKIFQPFFTTKANRTGNGFGSVIGLRYYQGAWRGNKSGHGGRTLYCICYLFAGIENSRNRVINNYLIDNL